jgi:hypothetical protein
MYPKNSGYSEPETVEREVIRNPERGTIAEQRKEQTATLRRIFEGACGAVRRAEKNDEGGHASRRHYELKYAEMERAAQQLYKATGEALEIPVFIPERSQTETKRIFTPAPEPERDHAAEARLKARRANLNGPKPDFSRPDSDAHRAWLNLQGVK